jgi:phospholipase C
MKKKVEHTYGTVARHLMYYVNPFKKKLMKTHCYVHRIINLRAVEILKNNNLKEEYELFNRHLASINKGVVWADQDFKSSNHFYHHNTGAGLYGFSNLMNEFQRYMHKSVAFIKAGDADHGLFYFGAACHLVHDATVPSHVIDQKLKNHREFELWIIDKIFLDNCFINYEYIKKYDTPDDYIKQNALFANDIYTQYKHILNKDEKYEKISYKTVVEAQATTAGLMIDFYKINKELFQDV